LLLKYHANNFKRIVPDKCYLFASNGRASCAREVIVMTACMMQSA